MAYETRNGRLGWHDNPDDREPAHPSPAPVLSVEQVQKVRLGFEPCREKSYICQLVQSLCDSHESLRAQVEALTRERDEAVLRAKRAWEAATDETMVGWHRDMALRLSEDRDIKKHRLRVVEESLSTLTALRPQIEQALKDNQAYGRYAGAIQLLRSLLDLIPRGEEA